MGKNWKKLKEYVAKMERKNKLFDSLSEAELSSSNSNSNSSSYHNHNFKNSRQSSSKAEEMALEIPKNINEFFNLKNNKKEHNTMNSKPTKKVKKDLKNKNTPAITSLKKKEEVKIVFPEEDKSKQLIVIKTGLNTFSIQDVPMHLVFSLKGIIFGTCMVQCRPLKSKLKIKSSGIFLEFPHNQNKKIVKCGIMESEILYFSYFINKELSSSLIFLHSERKWIEAMLAKIGCPKITKLVGTLEEPPFWTLVFFLSPSSDGGSSEDNYSRSSIINHYCKNWMYKKNFISPNMTEESARKSFNFFKEICINWPEDKFKF